MLIHVDSSELGTKCYQDPHARIFLIEPALNWLFDTCGIGIYHHEVETLQPIVASRTVALESFRGVPFAMINNCAMQGRQEMLQGS